MSEHNPFSKASNYMFEEDGRWQTFTRFLDDGRVYLTNNAAGAPCEKLPAARELGSLPVRPGAGGRAAFMYSLITTAKMNDVDPQVWLADVGARLPDFPLSRLSALLPWNWKAEQMDQVACPCS